MAHAVFVHGSCNKPPADELLARWKRALSHDGGLSLDDLGVGASLVHWADVIYASPAAHDQASAGAGEELAPAETDDELRWAADRSQEEREWIERFVRRTGLDGAPEGDADDAPSPTDVYHSLEGVPLPWFAKRRVMRALLRDVHHYLFDEEHEPRHGARFRVQQELRGRFLAALETARAEDPEGPLVVVCHGVGAVVAYDCLKRVETCPGIDALLTIGSPLGLDEVQDRLRPGWSRADGYPGERVATRWVNVFDRLDPAAGFESRLANAYLRHGRHALEDVHEPSWGRWRHDASKYLHGPQLRAALREMLELR